MLHEQQPGLDGVPDTSPDSRVLAWTAGGVYVMVNAGWDPAGFVFQEDGPWVEELSTAAPDSTTLAPRSVVVWRRQ